MKLVLLSNQKKTVKINTFKTLTYTNFNLLSNIACKIFFSYRLCFMTRTYNLLGEQISELIEWET
jgi:hypothetical protein